MELLITGGVLFYSSSWIMNFSCFTEEEHVPIDVKSLCTTLCAFLLR